MQNSRNKSHKITLRRKSTRLLPRTVKRIKMTNISNIWTQRRTMRHCTLKKITRIRWICQRKKISKPKRKSTMKNQRKRRNLKRASKQHLIDCLRREKLSRKLKETRQLLRVRQRVLKQLQQPLWEELKNHLKESQRLRSRNEWNSLFGGAQKKKVGWRIISLIDRNKIINKFFILIFKDAIQSKWTRNYYTHIPLYYLLLFSLNLSLFLSQSLFLIIFFGM